MAMERLLTIAEVADLTRLTVSTIRKHVWKETMPFVKLGAAVRFRPAEIEAWVQERMRGSVDAGMGNAGPASGGSGISEADDDGLGAFGVGAQR